MKKVLLTLAIVLVTNLGMAQDAFKKDVLKFLEVTNVSKTYEKALDQIVQSIPAEKMAEFRKEFDASIAQLMDKTAELYMKKLTHDDVKNILKFYDSPTGKKLAALAGSDEFLDEATQLGMDWGQEMQPMLMKYMQ